MCFQATIDGVRTIDPNRERTAEMIDLLLAAFSGCTVRDWRAAVRALNELLAASAPTASAAAHRRRLEQFVAENADLLVDD